MTCRSAPVRGFSLALSCLLLAGCFPPPGAGDQSQAERFHSAGKTCVQQQDFRGAVAAFEQALRADPAFAKSHYELGMVFERELQAPEKALYHYIRALELDPEYQGADLISNRLTTVRMQLSSSATPSFTSPQLAAEIDRLQGEVTALQAERARLAGETTSLKEQLAHALRSPATLVANNRNAQGSSAGTDTLPPEGPGRVDAPRAANPRAHLIQKGETMFGVSRQYQITVPALAAANPGLTPETFKVGRTIVIPAK